ncbi:uncharacterized protein LOC779842 isoform X2 [Xenopus tropicalis]|uniref:Uncharacterized protein LOC779842 isoform X2 n=1 Tax=Xenopus tropicalis TaxID=8364 RepID=A0A8J0SJ03_XENTR|nr:uncharacterized protein LOC779842 isoform X2 [Xenopus tropicalis]|eukprot:XP_012816772.1 PREDICTED: uncharacterized protein LOC779842 isoform X2 [Xenopus tropicalis]
MSDVNIRTVLVTGSNRGIGYEFVQQFLNSQNPPQKIFATCRDPGAQQSQELKNLSEKHSNVVVIQLDTTNPASVNASVKEVEKHLNGQGLDLLINNAGILNHNSLETQTAEDMMHVYNVNVVGPMLTTQAALNILSRCHMEGYKQDGIISIAIHPGWVQTDMGGEKAPITKQTSVSGMMKIIYSLSHQHSGTFIDWEGKTIPW